MPKITNSQKWAKRYSNCKSSLFKALHTPTITWQEVKEQNAKLLKGDRCLILKKEYMKN